MAEILTIRYIIHQPEKCTILLGMDPKKFFSVSDPICRDGIVGSVVSKVRYTITHSKVNLTVECIVQTLVYVLWSVLKFRKNPV
jgi:hypothetical protein